MRYDIWDMDEGAWSCWDPERGYLCGWLKKKDYEKGWFVNYGVVGRRLPSAHTMYRTECDEKERERRERCGAVKGSVKAG